MGFYLSQNDQVFYPEIPVLASAGRPDRSTELEVGRPRRSTDVHRTCTPVWLEGRSTGREIYSLFQATIDRAGRPLAQRSKIWPLAGRPTAVQAAVLPQRLVFLAYKREAPMDCFQQVFKWVLHQFFLHLLRGFSTYLRENISNQKGVYQECNFLEFSSTTSILVFLTNTWETHWHIHPIGVFLWDCF